jgi:hypothetical protein
MELKTIEEKKELLQRNLDKINTVVGAYIGARVNLKIVERKTPWEVYVGLEDNNNFASLCGVMSRAWKEVRIETFNIWWIGDRVELVMQFSYEHIDGGHNGAEFCRINVEDDFVTIK